VPVSFWKNTPPTCATPPVPPVPADALSGFAFSHAMSPLRSLAGKAFFEMIN